MKSNKYDFVNVSRQHIGSNLSSYSKKYIKESDAQTFQYLKCMNLQKEFREETGNRTTISVLGTDFPSPEYVEWLEKKLIKLISKKKRKKLQKN